MGAVASAMGRGVGAVPAVNAPTSPWPSSPPAERGTSSEIVTEADLERELATLRAATEGSVHGVFGPGSVVWRIDREAAVFLAAGRALLLQLAHPWVAAAIAEYSPTLRDPIGRFHRTFGVIFTMVFGTTEEGIAAARRLYGRHAAISGVLGEQTGTFAAGSRYRANDIAALRWVFATLAESAVVAFELVNPPLSAEECERYYREFRLFASFFGIPQAALPESWTGFSNYVERMLGSEVIAVSAAARAIATELLSGAGSVLRVPRWYRALTAELLPPRLREDFGLRFGPAEQRAARRAVAALRRLYPGLPAGLRYVAPYREACTRLAGRRPGAVIRLMNRIWIGRASLAG